MRLRRVAVLLCFLPATVWGLIAVVYVLTGWRPAFETWEPSRAPIAALLAFLCLLVAVGLLAEW